MMGQARVKNVAWIMAFLSWNETYDQKNSDCLPSFRHPRSSLQMEPPFWTMYSQLIQGWEVLFIPIAHSIVSFSPCFFQDWPSPAVGDVLMSSTALTCLCCQWLHSRSTSSSCARRRGRSSLSSRTEMWWKWTQNLVTFVCLLSTFFAYIYLVKAR